MYTPKYDYAQLTETMIIRQKLVDHVEVVTKILNTKLAVYGLNEWEADVHKALLVWNPTKQLGKMELEEVMQDKILTRCETVAELLMWLGNECTTDRVRTEPEHDIYKAVRVVLTGRSPYVPHTK